MPRAGGEGEGRATRCPGDGSRWRSHGGTARGPEPPWVGAGGGEVSLVPKGVPVPGRCWGHPGGRQPAWVWISGQGGRGDSGVAHVERAA